MVLTYLGNQLWYTDTAAERPTGAQANKAIVVEISTRTVFYYDGAAWNAGTGGTGEVNTASNVGTGGVGLFKQKSAFDLQFKKANAGSNKITITDDTGNSEVDFDVAEANLTLANLAGTLAYVKLSLSNSLVNADVSSSAAIAYSKLNLANTIGNADISTSAAIQYSKLTLTDSLVNADVNASAAIAYGKLALTNGIVNSDINTAAAIAYSKLNLATSILNADINASAAIAWSKIDKTGSVLDDVGDVTITTPASGDVPTYNGSIWINQQPPGAAGGEANTVSNIGTAGVGIWKQKVGVNHELKKINAGSSRVTITDDTGANEVDVDIPATTVFTGQANTFGAFDQLFPSSRLLLGDSNASHSYIFAGSDLTANRTVTWPLLTGNDVPAMEAHPATFTNKTLTTPTVAWTQSAKTANYTLTTNDHVIRADASAGGFTLTLPAAATNAGRIYHIRRTDIEASTNILTVDANASELIDGNATYLLFPAEWITIMCDGTGWVVINRPEPSPTGFYFLRKGTTADRRYVAGMAFSTSALVTSTGTVTADKMHAIPLVVPRTTKFDLIECEVMTVGAGSIIRLGIYRDDGNTYPGARMFDSGSIDSSSTTGAKSVTITAGIQIFQPGLYWLTYVNSATAPVVRGLNTSAGWQASAGFTSPFGSTAAPFGWTADHTATTALPDPYPVGAVGRTGAPTTTSVFPAIGLRPL